MGAWRETSAGLSVQDDGMDLVVAWLLAVLLYLAPLIHVALSPRAGPLMPPDGARCPFGPRLGWIVIVLFTGLLGWLMFISARGRRRTGTRESASPIAERER